GWEIYPNGIVRATQKQYNLLKRPIWVTENGTCDANDKFRCKYLYDHLKAMHDSKLPFMRYYHWCFLDNWEWKEGQSARFGLVHNNYETQERTIKKSGKFFMEMINYHGVTSKMYEEYVQNEEYNIK
ncbi:MAG: family 1 glycosylhydrolase, partial [Bacilli bacterium]|nr:family 1 glycosylhydrolase [Bacilli bacterium]